MPEHEIDVVDAIDYFLGLWEEADAYALEHIPDDIRDRANTDPDPASELRGLVIHMAALSDATRAMVVGALRCAKDRLSAAGGVPEGERWP